ncbi:unnamed protein product [Anisakis simplex]|uniref:Uncharacterized protein n=1 Tax=Anisakis simplex TaxID=6269 RepID=A0A0M3JMU3_ANISI|nr:unnamed protein product [Anisakis simplex]
MLWDAGNDSGLELAGNDLGCDNFFGSASEVSTNKTASLSTAADSLPFEIVGLPDSSFSFSFKLDWFVSII